MTALRPLRLAAILPALALAACAETTTVSAPATAPVIVTTPTGAAAVAPQGTLQRPAGSRSVAQLDTATAADRAAAAAAGGKGASLGTTTVTLGDATQGGYWLRSPLVKTPGKGRVVNRATGKSTNVDLLPLAGGGGPQLSLSAMRSIGAAITDLPEVQVIRL